jgi:uncharacterized protein (DUF4415 family)
VEPAGLRIPIIMLRHIIRTRAKQVLSPFTVATQVARASEIRKSIDSEMTTFITSEFPTQASDANAMATKRNVVLHLDKDLVEKSKEPGFNLSKTFENHLKHLMTQFSTFNSVNNVNSTENGINNMGLSVPKPK